MGLRMFYASSAGAVYAGVGAPPYDETSPVRPLAPYGDAKLAMEEALNRFSKSTGARVVAGRISNLYGPGQDLTKAQGLVSALLMGSLSRRPIQIYVSLDTIRDYLFVTDAADLAISCLEYLDAESPGSYRMKILCSGTGTTISALLGLTRLVVGRKPLIVQSASRLAKVQTRDLTMRSVVWSQLGHRTAVGMVDGLGRTYRDLLRRRTAGE
ncbi:UDP-glucose 4-epimerase [Propionibacterium cyclohexanicum]|uniref:UDP-glucose 4-epimerase n=2 Tax=Propionibacterium cyclohexanicum TaxID=64702 RepID=A0A1H9RRI4_9ACTN|nr:UDP-glucose 4-epimerase [Propionibacterium cyclohexanicum]